MRFSPLVAVGALTVVVSPGLASGSAPACGPSTARTLAGSRGARVYATGGSVYGCSTRSRRITRLGSARSCGGTGSSVDRVAVAGQTVAWGLHTCGVDFGFTQVRVLRLSDGRRLGSFAATEKAQGPESTDFVSSLVVKPGGAAAWVGTGSSIVSPARDIEVRTGHGHRRRLLDSGPRVRPESLRLHGSRLTWLNGHTRRSATLS